MAKAKSVMGPIENFANLIVVKNYESFRGFGYIYIYIYIYRLLG